MVVKLSIALIKGASGHAAAVHAVALHKGGSAAAATAKMSAWDTAVQATLCFALEEAVGFAAGKGYEACPTLVPRDAHGHAIVDLDALALKLPSHTEKAGKADVVIFTDEDRDVAATSYDLWAAINEVGGDIGGGEAKDLIEKGGTFMALAKAAKDLAKKFAGCP